MNILQQPPTAKTEPVQHIVLYGVGWEGYEKILEVVGERPVRVTYDRGDLELMSPLPLHEVYKKFFGYLLLALGIELRVPVKGCGSATFRRQDRDRGLEPDECFYLANAARIQNWSRIDLTTDPPPDLAVELDITTSCLNRLDVYAGLGVPELWRFDGSNLEVYRLGATGQYEQVAQSLAFPFLPLAEVVPLLLQSVQTSDDGPLFQSLLTWVRQRVLPLYQAAQNPDTASGPGV